LPNYAANEEMSKSGGMPFMPTSLESEYQTESDNIDPGFSSHSLEDIIKRQNEEKSKSIDPGFSPFHNHMSLESDIPYQDGLLPPISKSLESDCSYSDSMLPYPITKCKEPEDQTFDQGNGDDYQEQPVQHVPFNPALHESDAFGQYPAGEDTTGVHTLPARLDQFPNKGAQGLFRPGVIGLSGPYSAEGYIGQDYMSQPMGLEAEGAGGKVCGEGQGACCAGSNEGCPSYAPVCSEWGYCQCSTYKPGGGECGPGMGPTAPEKSNRYIGQSVPDWVFNVG